MTISYEAVPELLQQHPRWLVWDRDGNGKKTPRAASRPHKNVNPTTASNWTTYPDVLDRSIKHQVGIGFALGSVQDGPTFSGVDLDGCRNPATGAIEPWAQQIIRYL